MKAISLRFGLLVFACLAFLLPDRSARAQDDFLDSVSDHLHFSAYNGYVSARLSGLLDLEEYYVVQPPPGLVYEDHSFLFNPRLTLNLDVQVGPLIYLFAQARADRSFDPSDEDGEVRLEEYALRYTPWEDNRFNLQIGQFATVVGNWRLRHDSWENPFITAPLPYENQTSIWDVVAAPSGSVLNSWTGTDKSLRLPIIWGPSYTSGLSAFGHVGPFDYAAEIKNAAVSSRPGSWSATSTGFDNPAYSARLGWRPDEAWNLGVSSSVGTYLKPGAADTVMPGSGLDDYREILLAQDASFAWHHWQLWAECFETRFQVPGVGNADTFAYYVEAKYKFTPQLFGALRWNQQLFQDIPDGMGGTTAWGSDIGRIDAALTYRFTPHIQAKIQYSYIDQAYPQATKQNFVAGQLTVRF